MRPLPYQPRSAAGAITRRHLIRRHRAARGLYSIVGGKLTTHRALAEDVKAKAEAGALWCKHASDHAKKTGAKPWKYLLIPHDQATEDKRLVDFFAFAEES